MEATISGTGSNGRRSRRTGSSQRRSIFEWFLLDQDWRAFARCASSDPDLFFSVGARDSKLAKKICKECPVRLECLSYAMDLPIDHGTWGGMTERERRRCRRKAGEAGWRSFLFPQPTHQMVERAVSLKYSD